MLRQTRHPKRDFFLPRGLNFCDLLEVTKIGLREGGAGGERLNVKSLTTPFKAIQDSGQGTFALRDNPLPIAKIVVLLHRDSRDT